MSTPGTLLLRRLDLDVARELIVLSLILFHTARIFDSLPFYIKNAPQEPAVTFAVILTAFWGMPLLFTIAGFAIWNSLQKRTAAAFLRERLQRLLIPFITGLLIIVPPQIYFELSTNPAFEESYAHYYQRFFGIAFETNFPWISIADIGRVLLQQTSHLWFLEVLLVITLLMLPAFLYLRTTTGRRLVERLASLSIRPWTIVLPALPIAIIESALGSDISGGWNQSAYLFFVLYGYLLANDERFWQLPCEYWKAAFVLSISGSIAGIIGFFFIVQSGAIDPLHSYDSASVVLRFFKGILGWCWMVAILGLLEHIGKKRQSARQTHNTPLPEGSRSYQAFLGAAERYANEAVLPFYILHQTVIVTIGFYVVQWHINAALKFLIISLAALAITLLLYDIAIKRTKVTRFLFGMKPPRAGPSF